MTSNVVVLVSVGMITMVTGYFSRSITVVGRKYRPIGARTVGVVFFRPVFAVKGWGVRRFVFAVIGAG